MVKNKKKFIDKKNASTYHLLHRSQRDVAGDGGDVLEEGVTNNSDMILWPEASNKAETDRKVMIGSQSSESTSTGKMSEWRTKLSQVGLIDEYNDSEKDNKYLKPITGTGTFLDINGRVGSALLDARAKSLAIQEEAVMEVNAKQFDAIQLSQDCMEDDIAEALFGDFDEGDFEELNDDFVFDAAKEPEEAKGKGGFDFDAHIARLMDKARLERSGQDVPLDDDQKDHAWGKQDHDFFSKAQPLHPIHDEDEDDGYYDESILTGGVEGMSLVHSSGVAPALSPDEERALCEKVEQTLAEYDSDEVGECWDEEIHGERPLEGDALVEEAMDEFLEEREDHIFVKGFAGNKPSNCNPQGGSGFSALVGTRMVPSKDLNHVIEEEEQNNTEDQRPVQEVIKDAQIILMRPDLAPPPEEIQMDGKSYFSLKERNPWDCESILSTYSNLDNNPIAIGKGGSRRRKNQKKKMSTPEEDDDDTVQQIKLSNKTGLPIFYNNNSGDDYDDDDEEETFMSVNRGEARKKNETAAEKKARKAAIKKERQMARMQKKMTKEVYKEEFIKRSVGVTSDDVGGKHVFRYS